MPISRRGWICGLGHGVLPGTPEAAVRTFVTVGQRSIRMTTLSLTQLLEKYDVPVPRYTSYPAVPNWQETPAAVGRGSTR